MKVVKNMNTLKAMAKAGHIILDDLTGTNITGLYGPGKPFICYYINKAVKGDFDWKFKGVVKRCSVVYFDGCFNPYVCIKDDVNENIGKPIDLTVFR